MLTRRLRAQPRAPSTEALVLTYRRISRQGEELKSAPHEWRNWTLKAGVTLIFFLLHHSDTQLSGQFTSAKHLFPWTWGNCHRSVKSSSGSCWCHYTCAGRQRDEGTDITGYHSALPADICSELPWISNPRSVPSHPTPAFSLQPPWNLNIDFSLSLECVSFTFLPGITDLPAS